MTNPVAASAAALQIGLITFAFQFTWSFLQPMLYTDKHPKRFSLAYGMVCTLIGLLMLSPASTLFLPELPPARRSRSPI